MIELMKTAQKNEITECHIYAALAEKTKDAHNRKVLLKISADEKKHYSLLRAYTKVDVLPDRFKIWWYTLLASVLGVSFSLRLMEQGEEFAQEIYDKQKQKPFDILLMDEHRHEKQLLEMLNDPRVEYAGSIVLGLNDALVELTGALAGLSLALGNGRLVAITGAITGFAASLSMAASSYLSSKEEKSDRAPLKGALYTGIAYIVTVALLIIPFILIENTVTAMIVMLSTTVIIIAFYTFYISTAKGTKFWPRFLEMALISLGVAAISFCIGWIVRTYIGVDA